MAILVGRNVVKLFFDRRKNIFGSRLKSKLVLAFVGLTLVPTVILFFTSSGLLSRAMDGWFSNQVGSAVSGAVDVARKHFSYLENDTLKTAVKLSEDLSQHPELYQFESSTEVYLESQRKKLGLFSVSLVNELGESIILLQNPVATVEDFIEPEPSGESLKKAFVGIDQVSLEERGSSQFVRAYKLTRVLGKPYVLIVTNRVDPSLSESFRAVNYSYKEYEQLKLFKNPVRSGYLLTLAMITILILFAAIWIGFYIAREIVIPIQRLAEGTREIAKGNLDFHIRPSGDDEISSLVSSFNTMTRDLKESRAQAEHRRSYIEAILSNLAVGVIALDVKGNITEINRAAFRILGLSEDSKLIKTKAENFFGMLGLSKVNDLLHRLEDKSSSSPLELQFDSDTKLGARRLLVTVGQVLSEDQAGMGALLIFDDITELSKAQHTAAWREVARRIAHEIKNPLTPIQLSAQRLEKLLSDTDFAPAVKESANTIVEYVDSIKRLANEFTQLARMPTADFVLSDLNLLLSETMSEFAENNPDIRFQFIAGNRLPNNHMDRDQIRRCFINLIDNAIIALRSNLNSESF
ncbi:MAG: HAMP domain-containing protein, partial [Bdellovibrionota bacterium]